MKQSDFAHREILRQITEHELAPGTPLREVAVAESLGLSRTPVREALQRLVREGVATVVGRSVVVSRPTIRDLTEVYQAREAIEGYATALCAAHSPDIFKDLAERFAMFETLARDTDLSGKSSDPDGEYALLLSDLDQAIIDNCGNSRLTTLLSNIWTEARRIRLIVLTGGGFDRVRESATEHREICQAVAGGNGQLASQKTIEHLRASYTSAIKSVLLRQSDIPFMNLPLVGSPAKSADQR